MFFFIFLLIPTFIYSLDDQDHLALFNEIVFGEKPEDGAQKEIKTEFETHISRLKQQNEDLKNLAGQKPENALDDIMLVEGKQAHISATLTHIENLRKKDGFLGVDDSDFPDLLFELYNSTLKYLETISPDNPKKIEELVGQLHCVGNRFVAWERSLLRRDVPIKRVKEASFQKNHIIAALFGKSLGVLIDSRYKYENEKIRSSAYKILACAHKLHLEALSDEQLSLDLHNIHVRVRELAAFTIRRDYELLCSEQNNFKDYQEHVIRIKSSIRDFERFFWGIQHAQSTEFDDIKKFCALKLGGLRRQRALFTIGDSSEMTDK